MSAFKTIIASEIGYDKVYIEIYFNEKYIALINQEDGVDKLRIEFPNSDGDENMICRSLDLEGFLDALVDAKQRLLGNV